MSDDDEHYDEALANDSDRYEDDREDDEYWLDNDD